MGLPEQGVPSPRRCPACGAELPAPPPPSPTPPSQRPGPAGERRRAKIVLTRHCRTCGADYDAREEGCPECPTRVTGGALGRRLAAQIERQAPADPTWGLERKAFDAGPLGGLALMAVGLVWLLATWFTEWIFIYPIVLVVGGFLITLGTLWAKRPWRRARAAARRGPPRER
jgi:hypothetical protein